MRFKIMASLCLLATSVSCAGAFINPFERLHGGDQPCTSPKKARLVGPERLVLKPVRASKTDKSLVKEKRTD